MSQAMKTRYFGEGVRVWWTSQASGCQKTKIGRIVQVVPEGRMPHSVKLKSPGGPRNHESYVVKVEFAEKGFRDGPTTKARHETYYWPRASALNYSEDQE